MRNHCRKRFELMTVNNKHGLSADYFKDKLSQLVRNADNSTPAEMQRSLERLAKEAKKEDEILSFREKTLSILMGLAVEDRDLRTVTNRLNVSRSNLYRLLKAEGTSYQKIIDEVRFTAAIHYLINGVMSQEAIAEKLGFSDGSNFRRAFKKWSGVNPGAFYNKSLTI